MRADAVRTSQQVLHEALNLGLFKVTTFLRLWFSHLWLTIKVCLVCLGRNWLTLDKLMPISKEFGKLQYFWRCFTNQPPPSPTFLWKFRGHFAMPHVVLTPSGVTRTVTPGFTPNSGGLCPAPSALHSRHLSIDVSRSISNFLEILAQWSSTSVVTLDLYTLPQLCLGSITALTCAVTAIATDEVKLSRGSEGYGRHSGSSLTCR